MRRLILVLALMGASVSLASGVALAVTRAGGPGNDILRGTAGPDDLRQRW